MNCNKHHTKMKFLYRNFNYRVFDCPGHMLTFAFDGEKSINVPYNKEEG